MTSRETRATIQAYSERHCFSAFPLGKMHGICYNYGC